MNNNVYKRGILDEEIFTYRISKDKKFLSIGMVSKLSL